MPFEGTRAYDDNTLGKHTSQFRAFKDVRKNLICQCWAQYPIGTIPHTVIIEEEENSFGRQMGSYPILVEYPLSKRHTVLIQWSYHG